MNIAFTIRLLALLDLFLETSTRRRAEPILFKCYSCMSSAYRGIWSQILKYDYYPPMNFTDACDDPRKMEKQKVGLVKCNGECMTIAEEQQLGGVKISSLYMRGCINRLLLFGMAQNMRIMLRTGGPRKCLVVRLRQLLSKDSNTNDRVGNQPVSICSCLGNKCNDYTNNSCAKLQPQTVFSILLLFCAFFCNR